MTDQIQNLDLVGVVNVGCWVVYLGVWMLGCVFGGLDVGLCILVLGCWIVDVECWVEVLGFGFLDLGCWMWHFPIYCIISRSHSLSLSLTLSHSLTHTRLCVYDFPHSLPLTSSLV